MRICARRMSGKRDASSVCSPASLVSASTSWRGKRGGDAFGERRIDEQERQVGGVVDRPEIVAQAEIGEFERGHAALAPQRKRQDQHQPAVGGIAHRDGDRLRAERGADVAMQRIEPARRLERGRARALMQRAILVA